MVVESKTALEKYQRLVTVMFSDIAGSTRYFDQHGDLAGMRMLQASYDCLQPVVRRHQGTVVKTIGDAILAYFQNPVQAVRCGITMQRALVKLNQKRERGHEIRVRVALNLGVGLLKDKDVFGDVVNVCARIEHQTAADKIGVSPSVVQAIQEEKDIACRKMGTVELRGKAGQMDLYEVLWRDDRKGVTTAERAKLSGEQLALATGTRLGLDEEVRKAIAAAVHGKAKQAVEVQERKLAVVQVQPDRTLGRKFPLKEEETRVGRNKGDIIFPDDPLLSSEHARFTTLGGALYIEDLGSANGVFVRIRKQRPLRNGDLVLMGRQMFKFRLYASAGRLSGQDSRKKKEEAKGTAAAGAAAPVGELVRLLKGGREERRFLLQRGATIVGRSQGLYTFPDDHYMSRQHARFIVHDPHSLLEDLNSTNGSYVRIRERELLDVDDTVLVGTQLLRVIRE